MDASQKQFLRRNRDSIRRCMKAVQLALLRQAGDEAAAAIIHTMAEISHRESGQVDGQSLYDLGLDLRTVNGLEVAGVFCVDDLTKKTATEILGMGNFGATTLVRIQDGLSARGLKLTMPPPTPGGTQFGDSISTDRELDKYAKFGTGLTSYEKNQIVAGDGDGDGAVGDGGSGNDSQGNDAEGSKTPCEWGSNNHIGLFPKPKKPGPESKLIRARRANAAKLAEKLQAGRMGKKPPR